ncbi:hypothetical protein RRG08_013409 [Elysia crispata]|uniref:Uncharacterized protein n=1 Tax=Elysia crispata TaxID=231223 RepID=A0AAE0ZNM8_9GAST|nr:hypothetical protein RRG08_013409 [Elysia crispata]
MAIALKDSYSSEILKLREVHNVMLCSAPCFVCLSASGFPACVQFILIMCLFSLKKTGSPDVFTLVSSDTLVCWSPIFEGYVKWTKSVTVIELTDFYKE